MATKKTSATTQEFAIPRPNFIDLAITVQGLTPLIFHKWSEKAKKQIRDKQAKKASGPKEARNPVEDYENSFYFDSNGFIAFPALSMKQALVGAARSIDGITMAELKGAVFAFGDADGFIPVLVKGKPIKLSKVTLDGKFRENIMGIDTKIPEIEMREDPVTIGMGTSDLRYRGQVRNWSMKFIIKFNANRFSAEQILNLVQYAGFSCGLGEWRPEKNGISGTFEISNK